MTDKEKDLKQEEMHQENENEETEKEAKKEKKTKHKEHIESLETEVKQLQDKLLRNVAELENFKKRMNDERIKDKKYASQNLIADLVQGLDNLDRVVKMDTDNETLKSFLTGFRMINNQLFQALYDDGLKEIKSIGEAFNPHLHHAVEKKYVESQEDHLVLEEIQRGFLYKDRVLRPALVVVNEYPVEEESMEEEKEC